MPPPSEEVTGSVDPQLSKIWHSYRLCRYTPELDPLASMNSTYNSMSPNFRSLTRLAVRPLGPFRMRSPGPGTAESRVGHSRRSQTVPDVPIQSLRPEPWPFQPETSWPLRSGVQPSSIR